MRTERQVLYRVYNTKTGHVLHTYFEDPYKASYHAKVMCLAQPGEEYTVLPYIGTVRHAITVRKRL